MSFPRPAVPWIYIILLITIVIITLVHADSSPMKKKGKADLRKLSDSDIEKMLQQEDEEELKKMKQKPQKKNQNQVGPIDPEIVRQAANDIGLGMQGGAGNVPEMLFLRIQQQKDKAAAERITAEVDVTLRGILGIKAQLFTVDEKNIMVMAPKGQTKLESEKIMRAVLKNIPQVMQVDIGKDKHTRETIKDEL